MPMDKHKTGNSGGSDGVSDRFPVGMRVLVVDDDRTCLNILESLLRQCEYQVTSTTQAVRATEMLRENKNRFDLVISDVNMPDMDGFKLLELVGLEMDLPVIMLSIDSDTKLVMKGITHGAVDYLVKPVRLEELKNIWQHVVRKKFKPRDQNKASNQENVRAASFEAVRGVRGTNCADMSGKVNKKRKDQSDNEEEEQEGDQDDRENEGSLSQKKPRVVWAAELHKKFVVAVHQLGLDKAVPKKILELMNIEGLTRENVASHLQKYRLYLKKTAPNQANMTPAFGSKDPSFMRMASLDGLGDFSSLTGPVRLSSSAISSMPYQSNEILGRLNSPSALSLSGIAASSMIQQGTPQNSNASAYSLCKSQPSLLQGIPTSIELTKFPAQIGDFSRVSNPTFFSGVSTLGSSSNSASTAIRNNTLLQANQNQPPLAVGSLKQESFSVDVRGSSSFGARSSNNWQGSVPLSKFVSSSLPMIEASSHELLSSNNLRANNISWTSVGDLPSIVNTASLDQSQGYNQSFSGVAPAGDGITQNYALGNKRADELLFGHRDAPLVAERADSDKSLYVPQLRSNEDLLLDQMKSQNGFIQSDFDSLDEMMNSMIKPGQNNLTLMDGEFWI